ncbi:MAG: ABC transporter substrate-binding protein [Pseudomonadales bacterium]
MLIQPALAAPLKFAVVVPKTSSKAQVIYDEIIQGLRNTENVTLVLYELSSVKKRNEASVHEWLSGENANAIISIGKTAHNLVKNFPTDIPVIAGGVSISPNNASGVSLTGEPEEFFANLIRIAPQVDRVFLIYNEDINGWWVNTARAKASKYKIDLHALHVEDVKSGAKKYRQVLQDARRSKDAIWIPLVSIVPSKIVLPSVLKKAWEKNLVVFSNSATHTRQGALFSMYPDNVALGEQLAELAIEQVTADTATFRVVPVRKLKTAFNERTASHLGLEYSTNRGSGFDRIYPAQ